MGSITRAIAVAALTLACALMLAAPAGAAVWALSVAAPERALPGTPLAAVATLRAPPGVCAGLRGWGCLRATPDGAASGPGAGASACLSRAAAKRCQGWGDTGVEFSLYGPDDPTCSSRAVFHVYVPLTAAVAGTYASGPFVPQRLGAYRWTVALSDVADTAPPVGCADAAAVTVAEQPAPADPDPPVDPPKPQDPAGSPPPPAAPAPSPSPAAPAVPTAPAAVRTAGARPALERVALAARCVRPAAGGRVAVTLGLTAAAAGPVQVRVERALGTGGRERCPAAGGSGRFDGRFRTVATVRREVGADAGASGVAVPREAGAQARTAALDRRLTLDLRLQPALYRVSVRAVARDGRLSSPKRRFLRVLVPR